MREDWIRRFFSVPTKLMRVTAYFSVVAFVLFFFGARSVWGSAEKSLLDMGAGLAVMGDVLGPTYRVRLNGEPMNVASATTDMTVGQVLDQFEKECREHTGGMEEEFKKLSDSLNGNLPPNLRGPAGMGILRKELDGQGMVACLARDDKGGRGTILAAVKEVLATGDLAPLGKLRYVNAERRSDGKTHVLTVWTDGTFRVGRMFPESGDAPGADPGYMRPLDARRVLSAGVDGTPFGIQVYDSTASPEAVLDHYDREMSAQGWRSIEGPAEVSDAAKNGRAYTRAGVDLMVGAERKRNDGRTVVSIVSMPPR
jgi:hypothetical protein